MTQHRRTFSVSDVDVKRGCKLTLLSSSLKYISLHVMDITDCPPENLFHDPLWLQTLGRCRISTSIVVNISKRLNVGMCW